ncbi:hypothetical protein F3Y22_tig00000340pilonHSYRG00720 [Hibiscus syriacus]|uniref:Reverse transcriptase domain-containing protein n=1 Tax=Hibiscus syriacus TaxID=106335 RepID=A0A6A3D4X8_HIBSY|nr:hypothetical protein F3Y22_tig00000340pilonHSYRG00720 [Hibiscus syriacus]
MYSRKSLSPRCAIKIDLQKAFDSVNWEFLMTVLEAMGLPGQFCGWIKACVTTHQFSVSLNGSLVGFFKGARGVRRGDPLSPYLFVLVMNVFSSLLDVAAKRGVFKYHPKCKRISLTHLCFADDLLVFFHGSFDSVMGVLSTLETFYKLSGLRLNAMKTELYACGVSDLILGQIKAGTGFRVGNLPVRYLGVPLVTRKLTSKDCTALVTKIKEKLSKWANKRLSFRGRLQLIKSVLFSIFSYWSRHLILPKGVIRDVEKLCMRSLTDWSKACCLLLIKKILAGEGPLWIAWVNSYCFRSVDFWHADYRAHFSWILGKMFKLRSEASSLFCSISSWSQVNARWIWDNIRCRGEKVSWHRLVWFPGHIPKFSMISWMEMLDRLSTKDRLARFGIVVDSGCGLCRSGFESRDHIFSDCAYAVGVWHAILHACALNLGPLCWNDLVCWLLLNLKGKSLLVHILKLAWYGFIYFIWEERNHRLFRGKTRSIDTIVSRIKEAVSIKMYGCRMNRLDAVNRQLCIDWGLM